MSEQLKDESGMDVRWTDDCQGKKDYDADLVRLSSRYWPRGGSFLLINRDEQGVTFSDTNDPTRQHIRPSAVSSIILGYDTEVATASFEADTPEEVFAAVEAWAQVQFERVQSAVLREFSVLEAPDAK